MPYRTPCVPIPVARRYNERLLACVVAPWGTPVMNEELPMRNALQEQLLRAGLTNESAVKTVNKTKQKEKKQQGKKAPVEPNAEALAAQQAREEKARKDQELNRQRQEESRRKEIAAQVKQLIEQYRQPRGQGDAFYQFVDRGKVKKIYVTPSVRDQLIRGQLAIARLGEQYELLPPVAAEKIRARDPNAFLIWNVVEQKTTTDEDDPYAGYEIPDDLMW